jgi:hypothetical protein
LIIKAGKYFDHNRLLDFLDALQPIFRIKSKSRPGVILDFTKVEKISIINLLVFFKLVEYSYDNDLFFMPKMDTNYFMEERLNFFGFSPLLDAYVREGNEGDSLKSLSVRQIEGFLIAPQPLLRNDFSFRSKLNSIYLPDIQKYYNSVTDAVSIIFTCLSELSLNFWAHAFGDNRSILMAYGNKNKIEIGCADNGAGIITTLKQGSESVIDLDDISILLKALERGVTSKKNTNHMGYGLWLISEIAKKMDGIFNLYSEGVYLSIKNGKIYSGKCGYWKGTIVYLSLPLQKCFPLEELMPKFENKVDINWQ